MKAHWIYSIIVLCSVLIIGGCTKEAPPKESFTLYGYVTNCVSGKPVANTRVMAQGSTASTPGIFGTASVSYDLGNAVTDNNGFFRISLLRLNGIVEYNVFVDDDTKYISFTNGISLDSVQKNVQAGYDVSLRQNNYAYLKITYSDVTMPDASDQLSIDVGSGGNGCGPGFNSIIDHAVPAPSPTNLGIFVGNIQNGVAYYKVLGDNINGISFQKGSKFFTDSAHFATIYCKANDTTNYYFTY